MGLKAATPDTDAFGRSVDQKHAGIRPRYGIVLAITDEVARIAPDVKLGHKVLMEHGRWTRGMTAKVDGHTTKIWSIPVEDLYGVEGKTFTKEEKEKITKLYPEWKSWEI